MEIEGLLDDPTYIENLPKGNPLRARENVFGFSMSCASLQFLQMLALVLSPLRQSNPGRQIYHFVADDPEDKSYLFAQKITGQSTRILIFSMPPWSSLTVTWAVEFVSGSMIFSCSMIDPGHRA